MVKLPDRNQGEICKGKQSFPTVCEANSERNVLASRVQRDLKLSDHEAVGDLEDLNKAVAKVEAVWY